MSFADITSPRDSGTALTGGREAGSVRVGRVVVILAGAAILAAGCGTKTAPVVGLSAAVSHTGDQTARMAATTTVGSSGMSISFTETGVFDFADSRGMISMQSPVGITEIFLPPEVYINVPGGSGSSLPHGKSWIALDAGTLGGSADSMLGPFGGSADPADLLASLTAVSSSVTRLGTSTVRGVPVTGFRVSIDPAKAAARVPGAERAGFLEFVKSLGTGAIPVDVWVDGQNLVRRVTFSLNEPGGMGAQTGARLTESVDFYDFGVPVRISAPPAAQVASEPAAISGLLSKSAGAAGSSGPTPPPATGTLSPAQASAAEQAVAAFWSALGSNDPAASAAAVPPGERSCFRSMLTGGPTITVTSFRVRSARPAGNGLATVRFTVKAQAALGGQNIPLFPQGGRVQWLVTIEKAGHWYVDLARSSGFVMGGACG
jgi:hypothetical protein